MTLVLRPDLASPLEGHQQLGVLSMSTTRSNLSQARTGGLSHRPSTAPKVPASHGLANDASAPTVVRARLPILPVDLSDAVSVERCEDTTTRARLCSEGMEFWKLRVLPLNIPHTSGKTPRSDLGRNKRN